MSNETDTKNGKKGDWLSILNVIGIILFAGPFIYGLIFVLLNLISPFNFEGNAGSVVSFCGFITLVYTGVKRFQEELHRKTK